MSDIKIVTDHGFPKDRSSDFESAFEAFKNERDYINQGKNLKTTVAAMDWAASALTAMQEEVERLRAKLPINSGLSELDAASNACLKLAANHGFATGHGDTVADMIGEFDAQIATSASTIQEECAKVADQFAFSARLKVRRAKGPKFHTAAVAAENMAEQIAAAIRARRDGEVGR